jgi:alanyl-tRNA synthetase
MPGKKVFYTDPYLTELDTKIVSSKVDGQGNWYSFDETLFYPKGGGQSSDKGWINSEPVLDVQQIDDDVWHLLKSPISDQASMKLDWNYRFTNMQQHTGQHILSACFKTYHNLDTISVHLGSDVTMIELDTPAVDQSVLDQTEHAANQMIRDDLPVNVLSVDRSEIDTVNLRRTLKTDDKSVRLVQIDDVDCVGCGGTHVRSTAEVGLIKIMGAEKIRGHARIKIKIGTTAYHYFHNLHQTLVAVSAKLTTSVDDLAEKIDLLLIEKKNLINDKKHLTGLWLTEYVKDLRSDNKVGCFVLKGLNKDHLKILSEQYLFKYGLPCFFLSEEASNLHFYSRVPPDSSINLQEFVQQHKANFNLKGGGGKEFAVGQIEFGQKNLFPTEELFRAFKEYVEERSGK